ncbi:MAG: NAD(P)/FAD-dependent oxidoreductase [Chthoniobacter sp.]|uniref:NAD(P)/FAD-dependent oxidoreductase n=1 Tax=Chthoniobacter sp. TaxID=2510640 RepID=UPI0032AC53F9
MKVHQRNLPRVVVIGGGFGGLEAAKALRKTNVRVTLLDRQNHHLFQPLLYQVATAALSPADIAEPLRHILRKQDNTEVIMGEAQRVDVDRKRVVTTDGEIDYDFLILATGARHSYFGHDKWEKFAPGLKSLDDALEIRRRMLLAFEIAEKTDDDDERRAAMTFVVVGGGPTGMEMAGAIAEIARVTLVKDFRHIDSSQARVLLLENAPRVIPQFASDLSESARRQLFDVGVEVRLRTLVEKINEEGVTLKGGEKIPARTVIWAAGNAASPLGATLGVPLDKQGRVIVKEDCSIPGYRDVFVIGDLAHFGGETPLPGLSPVAMQQGRHVARQIKILLAGGWTQRFDYFDKGTMATIGRNKAVVDAGFLHISGWLAWLAWLFVHILFLIGFRNRLLVFMNWAYAYFTYGRGARLITGRHSGTKGVES